MRTVLSLKRPEIKAKKSHIELLEQAIRRRKQESKFIYGFLYDHLGITSKEIKKIMVETIGTRENPIEPN